MTVRVGFIGLGMMGRGMARNLLAKGFPLTVMAHRDRTAVEDLLGRGAAEARSPKEVADVSDAVVLCVTGTPQVEGIVLGPGGLLEGARPGLAVIDCSTSEPASTLRLAAALAERSARMADAPLTRTPVEAEQGRLNCMVGADPVFLEEIRPVLSAFCENVFHAGPLGAGHKTKLVNNFLAMGQAALIAEAVAACAATGVDLRRLHEVVTAGGVNSGIFQMIVGKAMEGDLEGMRFAISNGRKDLRYYRHLTEAAGLAAPLGDQVHNALAQAENLGLGDRMIPSLIEAQEMLNGIGIIDKG